MPLYSYLVHPVGRNLEFIHKDYYFWWEISLRWKLRPEDFCFALIEIVCDVNGAFKFSLLLPAVLLNTFWDNAMLCSWYRKHLFLDTWLVIQVYRNSNGVKKNLWVILYRCYESLLLFFLHILFDVHITNSCTPACLQPLRFQFVFIDSSFLPSQHLSQLQSLFRTRQSGPLRSHQMRLFST